MYKQDLFWLVCHLRLGFWDLDSTSCHISRQWFETVTFLLFQSDELLNHSLELFKAAQIDVITDGQL